MKSKLSRLTKIGDRLYEIESNCSIEEIKNLAKEIRELNSEMSKIVSDNHYIELGQSICDPDPQVWKWIKKQIKNQHPYWKQNYFKV